MDEQTKRYLIEHQDGVTYEGQPCKLGGWKNSYCTLAPHSGGFYHVPWIVVKEVLDSTRNFESWQLTQVSGIRFI